MLIKSPLVWELFMQHLPRTLNPFVSVGDQVKKGQTLAIVESNGNDERD